MWICGTEKMQGDAPQFTPEELKEMEVKATSIEESPKASMACSANAIILMVFTIFAWAFVG